jgi:hypothetical protein
MTALKIGIPNRKEKASRPLTMYQSLFVAQPNLTPGWIHHNTALAVNRIINA